MTHESHTHEILARNETAKASGKRLPHLGEILSPTLQPANPRTGRGPPADRHDDQSWPANKMGRSRGRGAGGRRRGHRQPLAGGRREDNSDPPVSGQVGASQPAPIQNNKPKGTFHCDYHRRSGGKSAQTIHPDI